MKKLSLLTLCLFSFFVSQAQSDSKKPEKKQKSFIVSIKTLDSKTINGRLSVVNDSQLVLTNAVQLHPRNTLFALYQANDQQYIAAAENIQSFSLKRKYNVLKGTLIGTGLGVACGVLAGNGDPEAAVGAASMLGLFGLIIGTIAGDHGERFIINGNKEKFRNLQSEIRMELGQK